MGQVPSAWNALPPLLHLANSYSSFKTHLEQRLRQEAFLISQAVDPFCSVLPCILCFPFSVSASSLQSVVVIFRVYHPSTDCELLEGREWCCVPVCLLYCPRLTLRGCAECLLNSVVTRRGDGSLGRFAIALHERVLG